MIDKISVQSDFEKSETKFEAVKPVKSNQFTNRILMTAAIFILFAIVFIYMTDISFSGAFTWKDFTVNGILIFAGSQALHSIAKNYARNKIRDTEEYKKSKEDSERSIVTLGKDYGGRIAEYCTMYTEERRKRMLTSLLECTGLNYDDYLKKYIGKNETELKGEALTKKQLKSIKNCNRLKLKPYDPEFLRENIAEDVNAIDPSHRYTPKKDDKKDFYSNLIRGMALCAFAVSIGAQIVVNRDLATVVMCLVKVFLALMQAVNGFIFGTENGKTEMQMYALKISEANACTEWCRRNKI